MTADNRRNPDISCLISVLKGFSESNPKEDEGFEHPLPFYDEGGDEDDPNHREKSSRGPRKRRLWIALTLALLLLLIVLVSVLVTKEKKSSNMSRSSAANRECLGGRRLRQSIHNLPPWTKDTIRRLDMEEEDFVSIGCFRVEASPDNRTITGSTLMERAEACDEACSTSYFALASLSDEENFEDDDEEVTCYCYVERPKERLSIGPCHRIDVLQNWCDDSSTKRQEMEVYFDPEWNEKCSQETTSTVRNFFVEEDDVPFGFDIVTSEFRPSPFELYKDECGTNVYEVQTEVSEGSRKLSTDVETVKEEAYGRRRDLASSIHGSHQVGEGWNFFAASGRVAGLADRRQANMFRSSGAQEVGSSVFTSFGVKRLAEVKIVDFDNKRDFVTFNPEFGALLRSYLRNGFSRSTAQQIFRTYGMFVVTRGIFGGYVELRTTMLASDVTGLFAERDQSRSCYERFADERARLFGFYGSASTGSDGCDADALDAFEAARRAYELDTSEADVVGGSSIDGDFAVSPGTSALLTSTDMYPMGDNGLALRPLTDFLSPHVISPLEVKRYQILEGEFVNIRENLWNHLREELVELEGVLDQCGGCDVPYMVQLPNSWRFNCTCYEPPPPSVYDFVPETKAPMPGVSLFESIAGTYRCELRRPGNAFWGIGPQNQAVLEIPLSGALTYDGTKVVEYEYDEDRKFLSWKEHGDVLSRADITFYTLKEDESFFGDQPNNTVAQAMMGVIDDGWFAASEIRGFLVDED